MIRFVKGEMFILSGVLFFYRWQSHWLVAHHFDCTTSVLHNIPVVYSPPLLIAYQFGCTTSQLHYDCAQSHLTCRSNLLKNTLIVLKKNSTLTTKMLSATVIFPRCDCSQQWPGIFSRRINKRYCRGVAHTCICAINRLRATLSARNHGCTTS